MTKRQRKTAIRCPWAVGDEYVAYHDVEWGVPVHDERLLFEFLILEGAQAGLSWATILKKRDNYRQAFDGFDPAVVAKYGQRKQQALLANAGIVRNRLKIESAISNARAFLEVQEKLGSSDALSKDLKKRGFRFVGSTICYAFMQAVGMVNDHLVPCFRYAELQPRQ
jgi:DNA-3-methyladenine glycosylase I